MSESERLRWRKASRRYRARHLGEVRARNRAYVRERAAAGWRADPAIRRAWGHGNYLRHRDAVCARTNRNRRAHPERRQQEKRRRRAQVRGAFVADISLDQLYVRDRGLCGICHLPVPRSEASVDHIVPLVRGGAHAPWNVQLAHRLCNSRKGAKPPVTVQEDK
jgi:5-methylcytosine-specific restriction endonuclease McrA